MLTPREKSPLPEIFSPEEDRTHDAASSRTASPTHYQLSYSGPHIITITIVIFALVLFDRDVTVAVASDHFSDCRDPAMPVTFRKPSICGLRPSSLIMGVQPGCSVCSIVAASLVAVETDVGETISGTKVAVVCGLWSVGVVALLSEGPLSYCVRTASLA